MSGNDGFMDLEKIPDVTGRVIVSEIFGLARPLYNLRTLCRTVPSSKITGSIHIATGLQGTRKVPPLVRAKLNALKFTDVDFQCWKNVAHIAIPDEVGLTSDIDVLSQNVDDAAKDIARMEDLDVYDAMAVAAAAGATVAGSDWGTDTNEPSADIATAAAKINDDSDGVYEADTIAMRYSQYIKLAANVEARKFFTPANAREQQVGDRYFGLDVLIDHSIPADQAYVVCKSAPALLLVDGPAGARAWSDGAAFFEGYATAKWQYAEAIIPEALCQITGI